MLYSEPVLLYCMLISAWVVVAFALSVFSFLLNSKEKGDELDPQSTTFFGIMVLSALIIGGALIAFHSPKPVPRTPFGY